MPEGPEIQRMADRINEVVEGRVLTRVEFYKPGLKQFSDQLTRKKMRGAYARSKALVLDFGSYGSLYTHNQLYGKWWTSNDQSPDPQHRQLRVLLETKAGMAKLYSASELKWMDSSDIESHPYIKKLGPEALHASVDDILNHISQKRFSRKSLHSLLLAQDFISGLGNYLRSEILFTARILPHRTVSDLRDKEVKELAQEISKITRKAYKHKGVTVPINQYRQLLKAGYPEEPARHYVYVRDEESCYVCGGVISKDYMSSRRIYYCPHCQN